MTVERDDAQLTLRDRELHWRESDAGIVVLDGQAWRYLELNSAGELLWKRLAAGVTKLELVELLVQTYLISAETARADVDAFLEMLIGMQFLCSDGVTVGTGDRDIAGS